MKKNYVTTIVISLLVIAVIVETIMLCSKKEIPTIKNGEEVLVTFDDGTKYSVDEIWKEMKESYGLTTVMNKVDTKILTDEYKDQEKDIENYVAAQELQMKANYTKDGVYDEEALLNALSNYGYSSLEAYLETVKAGYLNEKASTDYAKTKVTDSEIKDYYKDKIKADLTGVHVLVTPKDDTKDAEKAAKEKAEEIIKAIKADVKKGTKIEDAIKKYDSDDDDQTVYQDLGTFNSGDMVKEFENAAYKLKAGELSSEPVKTSYGYHVILITKVAEKKAMDEIKDEIIDKIAEEKVSEDSTIAVKAMDELRKKYGFKLNDDDLKNRYDRYINYQLNNK